MKRIINYILGLFGARKEVYKMYNESNGNSIAILSTQCGDYYLEKIDTNGEILLTADRNDALLFKDSSPIIEILNREQYQYTLTEV